MSKQKLDIKADHVSFFMKNLSIHEDKDLKIKILSSRVVELERQNRILKHDIREKLKVKKLKLKDFQIDELKFYPSIQGEKFYSSSRWRKLRFTFLKNHGGSLIKICNICKKETSEIHVDHIKSRLLYPELALEIKNLQILCKDCNLGKGIETFKPRTILRKP